MSFTEFTYQLVQGYDFLWLNQNKNCKLQMGGSDQWGNITTGTELIRRKTDGEAYAITCPLITKADGSKFGKTEGGNVWLDPERTSPYQFYQFWLNTSDDDAERYIKIFTMLSEEEINSLVAKHKEAPHQRQLQQKLAEEVTVMIHSREAYEMAVEASQILFGKATKESLRKLDEKTLLSIFEGVPQFEISKEKLAQGIDIITLLAEDAPAFPSKGELRRSIKGNAVSINKTKITSAEHSLTSEDLIAEKYILAQKGKKNYYLLIAK
ncbi:MAG: tyrosine--tRNA ligase [Draconibacterium sp.]|nr:MAG: tyrosine--tRNA ligase [Draconibacterium sp.]